MANDPFFLKISHVISIDCVNQFSFSLALVSKIFMPKTS